MDLAHPLICGKQVILEILTKNPEQIEVIWIQKNRWRDVKKILALCQNKNVKYQFVPKEKLDKIFLKKHQGIGAKIFSPGFVDEYELISTINTSPLPLIIALDEVQDQGNIGTLARTLYALGGAGIVLTKFRSGQLGDRAVKSSSGALLHLPITRVSNLKNFLKLCKKENLWLYYGGVDRDSEDIYDAHIDFPAVLILGREEKGVRPTITKLCHKGVKIPMQRNFDSLNVAQAGAILIGEFLRRWL